ncbi:separin-like [Clupea harengus]|uniref:Separin-like n=1 Tax=Clupea harengus TaxID=7950 RepID=A0A6P8EU84_CLUHA|nr:separin-like [Clupea harengus]
MRCVKTEDFVRRISTSADAGALHDELEGFLSSGGGLNTRAVCDRIIHACYQKLDASLEAGLVQRLVRLVQLAVGGYEHVAEARTGAPLYLEKMLFHILQKLMKMGKQDCSELTLALFHRLKTAAPQVEECQALVQNCFALLWNAAGSVKDTPDQSHTHTLRLRLEALCFRLLQESVCAPAPGGPSKACVYVEEALTQYRRACGSLTHTHATAMTRLLQECVLGPLWGGDEGVCDLTLMCVLTIKVCKMLCGAKLWDLANQQVAEAQRCARGRGEGLRPALKLCGWSVQLHRLLRSSDSDGCHTYSACTQLLSNLPVTMETHSQPLMEACQLVVWATETGPRDGMEASTLQACLAFLKQHQRNIQTLQTISEAATLQNTLCQSLCQAFSSTHTSLKKSQALQGECLQQVVEQLKDSVGELMQQLQKLANENLLQHAVSTVNGVVFELFNRKLHQEALSLIQPLCEQLVKSRPQSLPTERVNHCFLQSVQSLRRVGDHQGALQAVSHWLLCLSEEELQDTCDLTHTHSHTHPIKLWAKIKADAAKNGDEELRLR